MLLLPYCLMQPLDCPVQAAMKKTVEIYSAILFASISWLVFPFCVQVDVHAPPSWFLGDVVAHCLFLIMAKNADACQTPITRSHSNGSMALAQTPHVCRTNMLGMLVRLENDFNFSRTSHSKKLFRRAYLFTLVYFLPNL
jgi:hypothetical protein